jgi:ATP-binding cassette, subfamily B, bacterial
LLSSPAPPAALERPRRRRAAPVTVGERVGSGDRSSVTRRAIRFLIDGYGWATAKVAVSALLGGLAEAGSLIMITRVGFAVSNGNSRIEFAGRSMSVVPMLLCVAGLIGLRIALGGYTAWQSAEICSRAVAGIRRRLSHGFLFASWEAQQSQRSGSLQALLTSHTSNATAMLIRFTQLLVAAASLIALLGMAIAVNPAGALALVFCVGALGLLLLPFRSAVRRSARAQTTATMDLAVAVDEVSELGLELQVFGVEDEAESRLAAGIDKARTATTRLLFSTALSTPVYTGLAYLAIVGALMALAASDTSDLTSIGAAMLVMLRSLSYGQAGQSAYISVLGQVPAILDLEEEIRVLEAARRADGDVAVDSVGAISVDHVSFTYPDGHTALHDMSFTIQPGEIIGVIGPSGSGKSTLAQLLLGLRKPTLGRLSVDDRQITSLDRGEWADKVTFVPQASHMISGTIAENIQFMRDGLTSDDIERAARLAHVHDDIVGLPGGYDRAIASGNLSGGQQQRICIARSLAGKPEVLILDEPTSALDARSERLVRMTLAGLKGRITVILIAHRLSTLQICDRILVVHQGRVVAFDTPAELARSNPYYRESLALSDDGVGEERGKCA